MRRTLLEGPLQLEREVNKRIAVERDSGLCVPCYLRTGLRIRANDVHHVFGRAKKVGSYRERYTALMCVCRSCHDYLEHHKFSNEVEGAWLRTANETPINRNFKHRN